MIKNFRPQWLLDLIAALTAFIGLETLSATLYGLLHFDNARTLLADTHLTVIAGLSLVYLATVLRRGKYNAWLVSLAVYLFLLARNFRHFILDESAGRHHLLLAFANLLLPAAIFIAMLALRRHYQVKSETFTFTIALKRALIILAAAFLYGFIGFQLFDEADFHQEIPPATAVHYTVDQLGLTTNNQPTAHTARAAFFVDSLASISVASAVYVLVAFFAPIRFRLVHHRRDDEDARRLVKKHAKSSEDFFKLWPRDKLYLFNRQRSAMIAYRVTRGVALAIGEPLGPPAATRRLLSDFIELCRTNDWRPALINTAEVESYIALGLESQKIGEEALVDIDHFVATVLKNKYFRNISNRFTKAGYGFEVLKPPHSREVLDRLEQISDAWTRSPGRAERGFMLGYYSPAYLQQCDIAVLKNVSGQIQAFLNQVPTVKAKEANYDFLRHAPDSPGNINDFLMLSFIKHLHQLGHKRLNMGLCPLAGLEPSRADPTLLNSFLNFAFANGGRFYSFEGLKRFKSKYEPQWEDRYIIYAGGLAGFGRSLNALLTAMASLPRRAANKR